MNGLSQFNQIQVPTPQQNISPIDHSFLSQEHYVFN